MSKIPQWAVLPLPLLLSLSFAGCEDRPPADANLVIEAFHGGGPAGEWERTLLERFQSGTPGVKGYVRLNDIYSHPVAPGLIAAAASNEPPDVIQGPIAGAARDLVAQGLIADLTDLWIENGWTESYPEPIRAMARIDGRYHFVPQAVQWNPIWYRKDVFARLDLQPPDSWESFLAACRAISEAGLVPVTASTEWSPPIARWFTILDLRLNGPAFHEELMRGRVAWDDARVRTVFEHWRELFDHGCFGASAEEKDYLAASNELETGLAAMWNIGEWLFEFMDPSAREKLDFFSFPTLDSGLPRGEIAHVYGGFAPASARHPDKARQFLTFLGEASTQAAIPREISRMVGRLDLDHADWAIHHRRGLEFVAKADALTPLFEFSTAPEMAEAALSGFVRFWKDRNALGEIVEDLESRRQRVFGPLEYEGNQ